MCTSLCYSIEKYVGVVMSRAVADLKGKRFGKLVALEVTKVNNKRSWLCNCDCGKQVTIPTSQLNSGNNISCGCSKISVSIGQVFGDLTVDRIIGYQKYGSRGNRLIVDCSCLCGSEKTVFVRNLIGGRTTHCGCKTIKLISEKLRKDPTASLKHRVVDAYKRNAKNRNLIFELTEEEITVLFNGNCYYCGTSPRRIVKKGMRGEFFYNGIDRLDSQKNYVSNNVVSCCKMCNYLKSSHSEADFLQQIQKIARYRNL